LKEQLDSKQINVDKVVEEALTQALEEEGVVGNYLEVPFDEELPASEIQAAEIPIGHFMRIPDLSAEEFEQIAGGDQWEYLDGKLIHHSPASNFHNALLNLLSHKAMSFLDAQ
jgi:hypothetical protein